MASTSSPWGCSASRAGAREVREERAGGAARIARRWSRARGGSTTRPPLVARARGFDDPAAEVWIVFDGGDPGGNEEGATPRTVFARSADDWLLDRVRAAEDPGQLKVVTADRRLANRVRARGAEVVSPGDFLGRCPV
jgi:hypothetical protein